MDVFVKQVLPLGNSVELVLARDSYAFFRVLILIVVQRVDHGLLGPRSGEGHELLLDFEVDGLQVCYEFSRGHRLEKSSKGLYPESLSELLYGCNSCAWVPDGDCRYDELPLPEIVGEIRLCFGLKVLKSDGDPDRIADVAGRESPPVLN